MQMPCGTALHRPSGRKTFTEHYEIQQLPLQQLPTVSFHRYDLTQVPLSAVVGAPVAAFDLADMRGRTKRFPDHELHDFPSACFCAICTGRLSRRLHFHGNRGTI